MLSETYLRVYDTASFNQLRIKGVSKEATIDIRLRDAYSVDAALLKGYFDISAESASTVTDGELYEEMGKLLRGESSDWGFTGILLKPNGLEIDLDGVAFERRATALRDALLACRINFNDPEACGAQVHAAVHRDEDALVYSKGKLRLNVTVKEPDGTESYYQISADDDLTTLWEYQAATASERTGVDFDPFAKSRQLRTYVLKWLEDSELEFDGEEERYMVADITEYH